MDATFWLGLAPYVVMLVVLAIVWRTLSPHRPPVARPEITDVQYDAAMVAGGAWRLDKPTIDMIEQRLTALEYGVRQLHRDTVSVADSVHTLELERMGV